MPFFFTPGQFARHADFYRRFGQLLGAGLPATNALQQLHRHPPGRSYQKPVAATAAGIEAGCTLSEAARNVGKWLPPIDLALLEAGEASGRLENCMQSLADYYEDRARIARNLIGAMIYPVFLLHAAVFILGFPRFFLSGDLGTYLTDAGIILLPLYGLVTGCVFLAQSRHGEGWRALLESLLRGVPVLGAARRDLALARLSMALEALLAAGVTIVEAWQMAAASSGSPALKRTVASWLPQLQQGATPAELVQDSGRFPEVFSSQYATGEISGRLDETLGRLRRFYQEAASRKLHLLAIWVPWFFYLAVAGFIAYKVLQFWSGYFQQMGEGL